MILRSLNGHHVKRAQGGSLGPISRSQQKKVESKGENLRYTVVNGDAVVGYSNSTSQEDFIEAEWRRSEMPTAMATIQTRKHLGAVPSYWECFSTFCQQTILHGWHYLTKEREPADRPCCRCCSCSGCTLNGGDSVATSSLPKHTCSRNGFSKERPRDEGGGNGDVYRSVFWSIIVFASVVSGGFFLHDNTSEFLKSTVQTTLDSMVPLTQVLFPSVVVCNINQIRKSLFNELGFYENETLVRIMYEDFIKGTKDNSENSTYTGDADDFEEDEHHATKRKEFYQVLRNYLLSKNISVSKSIIWLSHQECDDMFVYSKWNGSTTYTHGENKRDFGTDYGICCWYTPQLNFSAIPFGPDTDWNHWFGTVTKGAKTGKDNGFSVLFDIESFDYGYYDEGSEGLKVAIVHHLDMPIMRQRAFHIAPGTENQIPITPTLYTANPQVLTRFSPEQRDCYQEHEIDLKYLPKSHGYRYEMSNCLFEAAFEKILDECQCAPGFHNEGGSDAMEVYDVCTGGQLACSNEILNRMGQYSRVIDTVDNVTKECLSNCEDQTNDLFVTTSNYPNRKTFKDREEFCILGKKLLSNTCSFPKRVPLTADFPNLCTTLELFPDFLNHCKNNRWRRERLDNKTLALAIESEIYNYAKSNLAIINIFIKEPYSKRFRKTEKMSRIAYIASSGGLLGLCMGFSFVSLAEILYHCFICVSLFFKKSSKSTLVMKDLYTTTGETENLSN